VSRTVAAPVEQVWRVVGDANHLPRWWPRVRRVEGVEDGEFTMVFGTAKGRPVRGDYRVTASERPSRRAWDLVVPGSPFERFVRAELTAITLTPAGDGDTKVTIELERRLRGTSRFGAPLVKGAMNRQLSEALDALEAVV
jgi:uncharacterized protein YndB with AHSA1/START domain